MRLPPRPDWMDERFLYVLDPYKETTAWKVFIDLSDGPGWVEMELSRYVDMEEMVENMIQGTEIWRFYGTHSIDAYNDVKVTWKTEQFIFPYLRDELRWERAFEL